MIWLVVLVAALAGAFLRALTSTSQSTWTWRSAVDTAMGGVASVVAWLILGVLPWTATTVAKLDTLLEQGLTVGVLSYIASHVWVNRGAIWLGAAGDRWFQGSPSRRREGDYRGDSYRGDSQ